MSRLRWPDSTNSVSDDPGTVQFLDLRRAPAVWRQVLLPLNVNYSCRFGRLLVRRRTVRWALLRVLKTQKTKRRERPLGDVHGVR